MTSELQKIPDDAAGNFGWLAAAHVKRVITALEAARSGASRFVGGCVRDSLLGVAPKDIDIATTLTPDETIAALKAVRLGVAPTGVDHGTVTAIADHQGVEVTTLRADVSTDGRRATVAFTRDWEVDARRRDFTVNAIYLTPNRWVYDPVDGLRDLAAQRVRFIGEARDRIREDYLRILRFFRFSARFANGFDETGLAACGTLSDGVKSLSAERVGDEFLKLLALPAPQGAISAMKACGVLREVWAEEADIELLARLKMIAPDAAAPLALAALFGSRDAGLNARLRLSNAQGRRRRLATENADHLAPPPDERAARALLYRMGVDAWRDACLLAEARNLATSETPLLRSDDYRMLEALPDRWSPPALPFGGKQALAAGVSEGPDVARAIAAAEERWIAEDFPTRERALEIFAEEAERVISKG